MVQSAFVRLALLSIISILLAQCAGGTPASPSPTEPAPSAAPTVAATPGRQQAYERLLAVIPPDIAADCDPFPDSVDLEPGQIGQADCDLPNGSLADFVSYKLFADEASMNAFFDTQRKGHEVLEQAKGPGCGTGPGEGTWEHGRKDCYSFFDDANVMWTDERLLIVADAFNNDGDYAKLEQFWKTAGPIAP